MRASPGSNGRGGNERYTPTRDDLIEFFVAARRCAQGVKGRRFPRLPHDATSIVSDLVLSILQSKRTWKSRRHFFRGLTKLVNWQFLNQARKYRKEIERRGELEGRESALSRAERLELEAIEAHERLNRAVDRLARFDRVLAEVVRNKFILGMTDAASAKSFGRSEKWVERQWQFARAWLRRELGDREPGGDDGGDGVLAWL